MLRPRAIFSSLNLITIKPTMLVTQDYAARGRSRSRSWSRGSSASRRRRSSYSSSGTHGRGASATTSSMTRGRMYRMYNSPSAIYRFKRTIPLCFDLNQGSATYGFKTATAGVITPTAGSGYGFGMAFQFTLANVYTWHDASGTSATWAVPSVTEFQSLFDSYRLAKIELKMIWNQNVTEVTAGYALPIFNICNDDDDANPPLGPQELLQRAGNRQIAFGSGNRSLIQTQTINPQALLAGAASSGGTVNMTHAPRSTWMDTNDLSTNFYGCKIRWDQQSAVNLSLGSFLIYVSYYIDCKGFR